MAESVHSAFIKLLDCVLRDEAALARGRQSLGSQAGGALVAKGMQCEPVLDFLQTYLEDQNMEKKAHVMMDR